LCYINNMPDTVSSFIYMYADNTKIGRELATFDNCENLLQLSAHYVYFSYI